MRPGRRRRLYIGASLALLLAGLGAAVAVATRPTHAAQRQASSLTSNTRVLDNTRVLQWKSGEPAPRSVLHSFANFKIGAPLGMNPRVRSDEVRTFPLPEGSVVWVAPAANGGLCEEFKLAKAAGCDHARTFAINTMLGGVGSVRCGAPVDTVPVLLEGDVNAKPRSRLQLEFSDRSFTDIALTWVGPPIDAGFFEQEIPAGGPRVMALVLRRPGGAIVAESKIPRGIFTPRPCPIAMPDGTKVTVPLAPGAETAKARKIISFRATDGSRVYLWLMPRTGGGDCFVFNQVGGCRIPGSARHSPAFVGRLAPGATRILFFGQAKPQVAMVKLRYQNGATERLTPIDGFVLHEIKPAHYKRGTRLVAAVALDQSGKAILTQPFQPQAAGVYPCRKPVNHICP